jgi:hypothetical protein
MRVRPLVLTVFAAAILAGCGSSSSAPKLSDARLTELSYFPSGSPLVMSIATDPNAASIKHAQALESRFPLAAFGQATLTSKLQQLGINYNADLRPLFGNPITVGAAGATPAGTASSQYLLVWVTKDAARLSALLKKLPGLHQSGSHAGATLYTAGRSTALAVSGPTLVLGPNAAAVNSALDRHAQRGGITSVQYARETAGLSRDSLIQAFGDLSTVVSAPTAANARLVPWVAALRGYGVAVTASASGLTIQYHLDTTGRSLTAGQLPFATGVASPSLVATEPISAGVHDPAQIVAFVEAAEQASNPAKYRSFVSRQAAVRARTGVDLNSFLKLLTGDLVIASNTHATIGRVTVSDPAAAARDLAKLTSTPNGLFAKGTKVTKLPGDVYAIHEPKAATVDVAVVGNQFVAGNSGPGPLLAFAAVPTVPAAGARGALAFRVSLSQVLEPALKQFSPQVAQTILSQLGDLTGWSSASTSGITGTATIAVK